MDGRPARHAAPVKPHGRGTDLEPPLGRHLALPTACPPRFPVASLGPGDRRSADDGSGPDHGRPGSLRLPHPHGGVNPVQWVDRSRPCGNDAGTGPLRDDGWELLSGLPFRRILAAAGDVALWTAAGRPVCTGWSGPEQSLCRVSDRDADVVSRCTGVGSLCRPVGRRSSCWRVLCTEYRRLQRPNTHGRWQCVCHVR